jgi:hypothetical protein
MHKFRAASRGRWQVGHSPYQNLVKYFSGLFLFEKKELAKFQPNDPNANRHAACRPMHKVLPQTYPQVLWRGA